MTDRQQRTFVVCAAVGLLLLGTVPFLRRSAGAVSRDLPLGEACLLTAMVTLLAVAVAAKLPLSREWRLSGVGLLMLTFVGGVVSDPLAFVVCLVPVTAVCVAAAVGGASQSRVGDSVTGAATPTEAHPQTPDLAPLTQDSFEPLEDAAGSLDIQRVEGVQLSGRLSFELPAGETLRTLHVPLWPPLEFDPQVTCSLDEIDGRVRVTLAKRYGLRIEVRLPEAVDEPLTGVVRFTARPLIAAA